MMFYEELTLIQQILLITACISAISLFIYYFYFFLSFTKATKPKFVSTQVPVSVIIAARNERENLEKYLPKIFSQNYPEFEVVVVNDGSFDGTKDFLEGLSLQYENLRIVRVELEERFQRGKKFALTMGIKAAKYEHLLFTDADCKPTSKNWISTMAAHFGDKKLVLGLAPLRVRNTPLGSLINYETFHTALQYVGYAAKGNAYMGVGRNMAYTKDLFFNNKGFASHQHLLSGDDDLFVQEVSNKTNTAINLDADAFMISNAPKGLSAWIKQKLRHLSTSNEYKTRFKLSLGFYSLAQVLFYLTVVASLLIYPKEYIFPLGVLVFKWLVQWSIMFAPARKMRLNKIAFVLPYYDILYTLYLLMFAFIKPFLKPKTWN